MKASVGLMARLPQDVKVWLAEMAKQNDRSMNSMLVTILKTQMAQAAKVAQ